MVRGENRADTVADGKGAHAGANADNNARGVREGHDLSWKIGTVLVGGDHEVAKVERHGLD